MFKYSCFIRKNTPELRQRLEDIGHKLAQDDWPEKSINKCRAIFIGIPFREDLFYIGYMESQSPKFLEEYNYIDCGENENLFLAIAAIQDDKMANQWYVSNNGRWYLNCGESPTHKELEHFINLECDIPQSGTHWHKATIEELLEHKF